MINLNITLLGLALALDAGIVSFTLGLMAKNKGLRENLTSFSLVSLLFGLFQGLTLWLGSRVGEFFTFTYFGPFFQYLVSIIFLVISLKLFTDTLIKDNPKRLSWNFLSLLLLALATSLDSFAAGISFATIPSAHVSALWIGVLTFIVCLIFSMSSHFFKSIPEKWILRLGAMIFFVLGIKIFVENFFKG